MHQPQHCHSKNDGLLQSGVAYDTFAGAKTGNMSVPPGKEYKFGS